MNKSDLSVPGYLLTYLSLVKYFENLSALRVALISTTFSFLFLHHPACQSIMREREREISKEKEKKGEDVKEEIPFE